MKILVSGAGRVKADADGAKVAVVDFAASVVMAAVAEAASAENAATDPRAAITSRSTNLLDGATIEAAPVGIAVTAADSADATTVIAIAVRATNHRRWCPA
jgi:hypothetical protein